MTMGRGPPQLAGGRYSNDVLPPSEQDCCAPCMVKSQLVPVPPGLSPEEPDPEGAHATCSRARHAVNSTITSHDRCPIIQWMKSAWTRFSRLGTIYGYNSRLQRGGLEDSG